MYAKIFTGGKLFMKYGFTNDYNIAPGVAVIEKYKFVILFCTFYCSVIKQPSNRKKAIFFFFIFVSPYFGTFLPILVLFSVFWFFSPYFRTFLRILFYVV